MSEEQTYGQDATGLREATLEVSKARESGQSGVENPVLPAPAEHKPTEAATDPTFDNENRVSVREAAKERLAELEKRRAGDDEFARAAFGEIPPQEDSGELDGLHNASIDQLTSAKEHYDTELNRLKEINDNLEKRQAEIQAEMQRSEANRAYREAMLAQVTQQATGNQIENYRQAKLAEFVQSYPELMTDQGLQELAKNDPYRYAEATKAWERANNDYLAARYQVEHQQSAVAQQQRQAFDTWAAQQDAAFEQAHKEFQGPEGKRALAILADATVAELTEKYGVSREQIVHLYNNDPNFRSHPVQEMVIKLGRDRLNREAIEQKRFKRALPPVQRPQSRDVAPRVSEQRMAQLNRDLSDKPSVRNAAKLLAERRRGAGR